MPDDADVITMKYFAYGSNMDEDVMQACCSAHRQLSDSYYPARLAEGTELATHKKLRGYSFAALERMGIEIDHFRDDLYARMPTPVEARLLHLGKGTPVVKLFRVTFAADNTPVEVTDQILASDRYVLSYEIPGTRVHGIS